MTGKTTTILLTALLFAGAVYAQTAGRGKEMKVITIRIDGFMKSKSGAI